MADGNFGNVSATGNIVADGYISAAGNVTAANLLFASPTTANISVGNIGLYNNLNMVGSLSTSGNVLADRITGNLVTANQPNITSVGTLSSLAVTGNATSGNVLTSGIISSTGNATHSNVTAGIVSANAVLANTITFNSPTTSNIDVGNLALYSNLNMTGSISSAGNITGARLIGNLFTANQPNITSIGTLTSLSVSGNATVGNVLTSGIVSSAGNATHGNVAAGIISANAILANTITFNSPTTANIDVGNLAIYSNLNMTGSMSAGGNIRGNYFLGNGYYLTGISGVASNYGNSNVAAYLPTYTGNLTANIISTTGNITGSYILGNGSQLTGITSSYGNANTANFLANFGSNTISTTGSISAGDVTLNNLYSPNYFANAVAFANATGYITTSSLFKYNSGTEVLTVGTVSATGNITANYFVGNGSQLTDLPTGYSNADVSTYLANSNVVISTTGNITGSYILGNGSQLTGIAASYGNANVVANLAALGSNPISTTGNITAGNISTGVITLTNGATIQDTVGDAVAFGSGAGLTNQGLVAVAIGNSAGNVNQGNISVAIGYQAGNTSQGDQSVAIGDSAGKTTQGESSVAVGQGAGQTTQGGSAIAIGFGAGAATQGTSAIAFGRLAGQTTQGISAVAVGDGAGQDTQGQYAVAIGYGAGNSNQANNSIILNATGSVLEQTTVNTFTVKPVRQANTANAMYYDASTGEITYDTAGGGGNTGNVTFNDINIIGTGNLKLQPDSANASAYLDIFLTGGPDIHIAGNGETVILGTDDFANVTVNIDGNVSIQSGDANGTHTWNFDTTGNLSLPLNSVVYETNIPDGGLSGSAIALKPTGGTNADQQLLIYPTTNDANHLHLTSGNLYSTELFFGNDNLYVKLANTGNVVINSNNGIGNSAQWTFDTTGNLTTPGGMIINGNTNTIGTQTALLQAANDLPLSFIASGANGSVTSFWAEDFANLMTSNIAAIYTPLQNTQTVRIVTGSNGGNIAIYDFDDQGMFTAAAVCATGNVYAGNVAASGNVSGVYILGNGSGLTSLPAPVVTQDITSNGAMSIMTYDGNIKYVNNATIEPSSGNIAGGNISASGNITGSNILFGSGIVSGTGNINGNIGTFTTHNGTTFSASGNITGGNISASGNISGNTNGFAIGYLSIPQVAAGNATLALTDAGKHYYSTSAGDFTLTIPTNANVAFDTGTAISIVVQSVGNILVNAASGVTLYMAGNSTAGNRVVSTYGMATLMKVASDTWFINGTGVA